MHELSIALSIVEGVLEEAEKRGGPAVCAVHLRLGPLSGVDKQALLFAYPLACEGTPLQQSQLVIEDVEVELHCPKCACNRKPPSVQELICPVCGSAEARVITGGELDITAFEISSSEVEA